MEIKMNNLAKTENDKFFNETFTPQGYIGECNWGGLEVELSNTQEMVRVRRNWGQKDLESTKIYEYEIESIFDEDWSEDGESDDDCWRMGVKINDDIYWMSDILRI